MGAIRLDWTNILDNMRNYYDSNYDLFANVNINFLSLLPVTATLIPYIIYFIYCYNIKYEESEEDEDI